MKKRERKERKNMVKYCISMKPRSRNVYTDFSTTIKIKNFCSKYRLLRKSVPAQESFFFVCVC